MTDKRRVILVDDEYLANDDLKDILNRRHPDFEVVGVAETTAEAWALIKQHPSIDGVFLDINLQTESERIGRDFAYALSQLDNPPWIVFVTGYKKHAEDAFALHPAHYLLKPLDDFKVDQALAWIRKNRPMMNNCVEIEHHLVNAKGFTEKSTDFVAIDEIIYIEKNQLDNTLNVRLLGDCLLSGVKGTITEWETKLTGYGFVRAHQQCIANTRYIECLSPRPGQNNAYQLSFKVCTDKLDVDPNYLNPLRYAIKKRTS